METERLGLALLKFRRDPTDTDRRVAPTILPWNRGDGRVKRICAWCGTDLGEKPWPAGSEYPITHGICEPCSVQLWGEEGTPLNEFLESLEIPTLLVSGDGIVGRANQEAMGLVGKNEAEVDGRPGGEVFDCVNSTLPGGCGRTIHCSACTIRQTVTHTYETGESRSQVPAVLKIRPHGVPEQISFFVTTEKVGDRVLVQIDPRNS